LRDAVTRLEALTKAILSGENNLQVPLTATSVPLAYEAESLSGRKMVPRDRIELSTPAFSGQEESEQDQTDKGKTQCKK